MPNPRRCFKCRRYGHGTDYCRDRFVKCAAKNHPREKCNFQIFTSFNCQGPQPAYSRTCEKFKLEKQIIKVKLTENIAFPEGRESSASFSLGRYANAARRGVAYRLVSVATQVIEACGSPPCHPSAGPALSSGGSNKHRRERSYDICYPGPQYA